MNKIKYIAITIALLCAAAHAQYTEITDRLVYTNGITTNLTAVAFRNRNFYNGGGIYMSSSTVTVHNALFETNSAFNLGGAIFMNSNSTLTVDNTSFVGNTASNISGGAIYNNRGTVTISNSTFTGNSAPSDPGGGAIYNYDGAVTLTDVSFYNNTVTSTDTGSGGAISSRGTGSGSVTLNVSAGNISTISGNRAVNGNGIYIGSGSLIVNTIDDGVLDMQDAMDVRTSSTVTKNGTGQWKVGGTNSISSSGLFSVNEGELFLYEDAVMDVQNISFDVDTVLTLSADSRMNATNLTLADGVTLGFREGSYLGLGTGTVGDDLLFNIILNIGDYFTVTGINNGNVFDQLEAAYAAGTFDINRVSGVVTALTDVVPEPTAVLMLASVAGVVGLYRRFFCKL